MKYNKRICSIIISGLLFISITCCHNHPEPKIVYQTELLEVTKLNDHMFIHRSYLNLKNGTKVSCNGVIFIDNNEAIVFDTPTSNEASSVLIQWVEDSLQSKITTVVPTHFHVDCLGGLEAFHNEGINSIANEMTIALAKERNNYVPKSGFNKTRDLYIGKEKVSLTFFGEGHTIDNVVAYIPSEKALFGGCLIKSLGATKGNLEDANTNEWPTTAKNIKSHYKDLKIVIPGHGEHGNTQLLDYTMTLFETQDHQ
ncbi:subclass B1 metallo-beta-lactamase [uncultured Psychroserpens sp.]|uniref:subclass B1 metallo-beta-lactamase n=1 Tax=uncultured Psychroserpens sp. TaxID=255436 RepID=UPI002632A9ED|nr:subclass B1 metallo-beta-lactamase [uncultured Psychroserpens sp.]